MAVEISSLNKKTEFGNNKVLTVGSSELNDFFISFENFELILEFDEENNTYSVINNSGDVPYFKGQPFKKVEVTKVARFLFPNSDEFINIKILADVPVKKTMSSIQNEDFDENDIKNLYADEKNAATKIKLDKSKENIELRRVAIISEVSHKINDLKSKLSQNTKGAIFAHFALFWGCFVCAFATTNYIVGLSIQESADYIHLPTDLKLWLLFTVLIMGVMFIFKQGMYGYFYSQGAGHQPKMPKRIQIMLVALSSVIMFGVYVLNLVYYVNYTKNIIFPLLISLFFVGITICIAVAAAHYKSNGSELAELLNKYEYREDFEKVLKDYQSWIGHYVNNLSVAKIKYISDKVFELRIKEVFETIIGILTAPFLAFGVSNTLASCFPEAAGWVRISGVRFSPVFLVLATCLVVFAFFLFVNAFTTSRKISNSDIIKHDGFSNYLTHCAEIFGLEATIKAKKEMSFSFFVALSIIIIEFTMNVSYFSTEIGQDFAGLFLSFVAALVPTSLLIAETFLLAKTKFGIYAIDELRAKVDK